MARVRWGILGCGSIAMTAVAPAIGWSANGELVAIASRDLETARRKAASLGSVRAYAPYERLLLDPDVDAVYIGLPNGLHEEWATRAALAGKHVLCEKSLTLSLDGARRLTALFADRRLRLVEAFMYRHHPQWNVVRGLVRDGAVGTVRLARAVLAGTLGKPEDHRWSASLGGGVLHDLVCHAVDALRFVLASEPVSVCAMSDMSTREGVDVSTEVLLEFPGPVLATAMSSLESAPDQRLVVTGTRGRIEVAKPFVPGWEPTSILVEEGEARREVPVGGANHFLHQVEHFARLVLDSGASAAPAEDGLGNAVVLDAVDRSRREARTVRCASPGRGELRMP
jgi:D-xylose 1-dehydrogenase (NADP+, D-xylono-1,5-lactone-forming)